MAKASQLSPIAKKRLKKLSNRYWRLNNLYWIIDEDGNKVQFKVNPVQELLYFALWWLNVIPKSRQHGITTFIALFILDACLFNSNVRAGIIAHRLQDAKKIFRDKIRFAYDNLPDDLKAERQLVKDDAFELIFANNSGIYVGTSMRSGTLKYLHISEYGKLCARTPIKAQEIKTGAMETVHEGGIIFVESTAEGAHGDFYDMCTEAQRLAGKELSRLDYKMHFFAWHEKESNVIDPTGVQITDKENAYFDKLEQIFKKEVRLPQRAWYVKKKARLKHDMFKEHPSTLEEAFIASVEGAYYAAEMAQAREEGRICRVPHLPDRLVHTVCDLGLGSHMPWIFFQAVGMEIHLINTFCLSEKTDTRGGMAFYKGILDEYRDKLKYSYGKHFCPFDINKGEIGTGKAIYETADKLGLHFVALDREIRVTDGIERLTNLFPRIWIDSEKCQDLITSWSCYHREWIENLGRYSDSPAQDKSNHYADAGRYLAMVIEKRLYEPVGTITQAQIQQWQEKYRRTG